MTNDDPFRDLDRNEAIDLRWSLRDIRGRRWKMSPIKAGHIEKLLAMGLIEFQDEVPVLTNAGLNVIVKEGEMTMTPQKPAKRPRNIFLPTRRYSLSSVHWLVSRYE